MLREYLRLKKEKREVNKITGRKVQETTSGDETLKNFEKSTKFAMTFVIGMFTSGIGGYFASKIFLGLDHTYVDPSLEP